MEKETAVIVVGTNSVGSLCAGGTGMLTGVGVSVGEVWVCSYQSNYLGGKEIFLFSPEEKIGETRRFPKGVAFKQDFVPTSNEESFGVVEDGLFRNLDSGNKYEILFPDEAPEGAGVAEMYLYPLTSGYDFAVILGKGTFHLEEEEKNNEKKKEKIREMERFNGFKYELRISREFIPSPAEEANEVSSYPKLGERDTRNIGTNENGDVFVRVNRYELKYVSERSVEYDFSKFDSHDSHRVSGLGGYGSILKNVLVGQEFFVLRGVLDTSEDSIRSGKWEREWEQINKLKMK